MQPILLSPPDVREDERQLLLEAVESNWVAPVGPDLDAFECEVASVTGRRYGVALSSGTAALHLCYELAGVRAGDDVVVPTLTFIATASAATYLGARPVFIDVSPKTWTLDPQLLSEELATRSRTGRMPAAVVAVDLYGQCADYDALQSVCDRYDVPLISDAAEALGAAYRDRPAGSFGLIAALSFNGNKIITTSGGGMLCTDDSEVAGRARYLAAQARQPALHYEHQEVGYNYRLSNLLAAFGRGQLRTLADRVSRRRDINARYRAALGDVRGLEFMPFDDYGRPSCWLTVATADPAAGLAEPATICRRLAADGIEARPAWKPLHRQPVFADAPTRGGAVADRIYRTGLCLPSGSGLHEDEQGRVIEILRRALAS